MRARGTPQRGGLVGSGSRSIGAPTLTPARYRLLTKGKTENGLRLGKKNAIASTPSRAERHSRGISPRVSDDAGRSIYEGPA